MSWYNELRTMSICAICNYLLMVEHDKRSKFVNDCNFEDEHMKNEA